MIIQQILLLVMAPPESPPDWLWLIMFGLVIFCAYLLATSQGVSNPFNKSKTK